MFECGFEFEFKLDFELDFELKFESDFELKLRTPQSISPGGGYSLIWAI